MKFFYNRFHSLILINTFIHKIFPLVDQELTYWHEYASSHCSTELKKQALSSIKYKKFHCQGGAIYSLYPGVDARELTPLIVALQTISDYLDNLCDRAAVTNEKAFRQLHYAITDALDPESSPQDYYAYYPLKEDGGYLKELVQTCQHQIRKLPSYSMVKEEIQKLALLYSDLQTYKHLALNIREEKMTTWINGHRDSYPQISQWEFAAATGSTLGMFMLCAAASDKNLTSYNVQKITTAYFPWISGLHILLDYFIDSSEDQANGDLNFVSYYTDQTQIMSRLSLFTKQAFMQAGSLPQPSFHRIVVQGLLAMYLSDPKTTAPKEHVIKSALLKNAGWYTRFVYFLCKLLRIWKKL